MGLRSIIISGGGSSSGVTLNPSPATTTVSGTTVPLTAGANLSFGNICYINSSSQMVLADESSSGKFPAQYMAAATISSSASGLFLVSGFATLSSWTWTPGGTLYLSTSGAITQTPPSSTGNAIQVLGFALTATTIFFNPSPDYITHT